MFNVVHICTSGTCAKQSSYGFTRYQPQVCMDHKTENMWNVMKPKCKHCLNAALYGTIKKKATACRLHRESNMFNVFTKYCHLCKSVGLNPSYKPYCARCHFHLNPTDPRKRAMQEKERAFTIKLKQIYPDLQLNSTIVGGSSKRRPDAFIELQSHSIVVEIDEFKHSGYDTLCENRRLMDIFTDLGNRPLVVIRLNPDGYSSNGKRVKGCFTKKNINQKEFNTRMEQLLHYFEYHMKNIPQRELLVIKLFFN